jgi:hypothetical protein
MIKLIILYNQKCSSYVREVCSEGAHCTYYINQEYVQKTALFADIGVPPLPISYWGGGGGAKRFFWLFNTQNRALRAHRPAHRTFANLSGEINDIYRKPREKPQFGKNPRKCTTSHEVQYSNATGGGTVNLQYMFLRLGFNNE